MVTSYKQRGVPMNRGPKRKRVSVSSKRQISIPKDFFDSLDLGEEVFVEMKGDHLIIRPAVNDNEDFSEEILQELIEEGYNGSDLMAEFKRRKKNMKYAVQSLVAEARESESIEFEELFGENDDS